MMNRHLPSSPQVNQLSTAIIVLFALMFLILPCRATAQELVTIPDAKALAEAKKLVDEVYADLLDAKTDEDRVAAARVLIMRAEETENALAAKYMMYDTARSLAVQAGDTETTMDAIGGLAATFDNKSGGFIDLAVTALQDLSRKARSSAQHAAIAQAGIAVIEQLTLADRHGEAMNLLARIRTSAQRSRRPELVNAYKAMQDKLRTIRDETERITDHLKAIEQNPDDPALNLSVGRYLALYRDDWEAALPLLSRSSDEALAAAAKADLAGARDTKTQIALGDQWWAIASQKGKLEKQGLSERAKYWYRLALTSSTGIERAVLTKRLEPAGQVKWGDLVLKPGIRTMFQADDDKAGAKPGPIEMKSKWPFKKKPLEADRTITLHFDGYLYFPETKKVGLMAQSTFCSMTVEINGNRVFNGRGSSEVPVKLIKGYNAIRGSVVVTVARIENPDQLPIAELFLTELDGKSIDIPAEHWFHDATQ